MVNKRFNRKFRRALGVALGALSVASISNVDVVNAEYWTETKIVGDADLKSYFKLTKQKKKALFNEVVNNFLPNVKYGDPGSAKHSVNVAALGGANCTFSFPECYEGKNDWDKACSFTVKIGANAPVRITIFKSNPLFGELEEDYLLTPYMKPSELTKVLDDYNVPHNGSWLVKYGRRPNAPVYLKASNNYPGLNPDDDDEEPSFPDRGGNIYTGCRDWNKKHQKPKVKAWGLLVAADRGDKPYLTRWKDIGMACSGLWDDILKDDAGKKRMLDWTLDKCPESLMYFYYPPKPALPASPVTSDTPSLPAPTSNFASTSAGMAAVGLCTAVALTPAVSGSTAPIPANSGATLTPVSASSGNITSSAIQGPHVGSNSSQSLVNANSKGSVQS